MRPDNMSSLVRLQMWLIALFAATIASHAQLGTWGLLASPGYENKPVKGMYFFPGDPKTPELATSTSDKPGRDDHWDDPSAFGLAARNQIITEIAALGTNVIFDQYSGPYTDIHFVINTEAAFLAVFFTSDQTHGPLVVPSLEASFQCGGKCPTPAIPTFDPPRDIGAGNTVAADYVTHLVDVILANGMQRKWAQIYDRSGSPRYAIQIAQATALSIPPGHDAEYFAALEAIQQQVFTHAHIHIGFVLTPVEDANHYSIVRSNPDAVANLKICPSCLAVLPYFTEVARVYDECSQKAKPDSFRGFIDCNDGGLIENLSRFKKDRTKLWVNSGAPYYVDLDAGYDAHIVFNPMADPLAPYPKRAVGALWGETGYPYDKWRNAQSELKGHQGDGNLASSGVVFNSWNGFTEISPARDSTHIAWDPNRIVNNGKPGGEIVGYPSSSAPVNTQKWARHDFLDVRRRWLTDVFSVDPRLCDHFYYENGQRKFHVIGAICEKFTEKYGEYGPLGAPISDAHPLGTRTVEDFQNGQIYWNGQGAREMHGGIYARYRTLLQNGRSLGAPVTDELIAPDQVGHYNHFESGSIYWTPTTLGIGIWGPFQDRWAALGWERGRLAYPTLEPTQSPGQAGWYERFQGGNMYARSSAAPAFEVWGSILAEYGRLGWERSWLGYPLTGEGSSGRWCPGGRFNQFEHGFIDWCPGKNACSHHGDGHCDDGRARPSV